jgi:hypothetical protein
VQLSRPGVVKTTAPTGAATAPVAATEPETPVQHNLKTHPAASEPSFAVRLERVRATARETAKGVENPEYPRATYEAQQQSVRELARHKITEGQYEAEYRATEVAGHEGVCEGTREAFPAECAADGKVKH